MATTTGQRIGIAVILVVTVVGTLGSFLVMILSQKEATQTAQQQQKDYAEYETKLEAYQAKVDAQTKQLSDKYYAAFSQNTNRVAEFNLDEAEKNGLKTVDITVGNGEEITDTTKFAAYYIGWLPSGKIFDQSIDTTKGQLKAPLSISDGLANASLIQGWKDGMKGMKIGGVRELTIPSDKAYAEEGSKDSSGKETIPANTPLKFVVMAISLPETIATPEYPASLLQGAY